MTTTLDYTTALSAAHDDAASSLERSREQLEELLRALGQQRAEINDELDRVRRALATLKPAAPEAPPTPTPEPAAPRRGARRAAAAKAEARRPRPGTSAYRVAEAFAQLGTATAKVVQERAGVDTGSVHRFVRQLQALGWIRPGVKEGRTQTYAWSGPELGETPAPSA